MASRPSGGGVPAAGGFRRRREAEDPNNTWNMQLFTALLTKNFAEASNLVEKGANVNHSTSNIISSGESNQSGQVQSSSLSQQQKESQNNNNNNNQQKEGTQGKDADKQTQQSLLQQQQQQKLLNNFLRSGGTVPLCVALVFRASGVANYGEASPGAGVSPATMSISDATESLAWLYEHGCNLNALVDAYAKLSAAQQQQQQQQNIPTSMTALQRPVSGTMLHICVYFDWSDSLEKLLKLRIKLVKKLATFVNSSANSQDDTNNNNTNKPNPDFLISAGVCDAGHNKVSPTVLAVNSGKLDLAKVLLRNFAPFDFLKKADHDHTALARAAVTNDIALVELLLQLGDDPEQLDTETGRNLLQVAYSAFDRQSIDPALACPASMHPNLAGGTGDATKNKAGGGGGGGGGAGRDQQGGPLAVFNTPSTLLVQQQQILAHQQQLLNPATAPYLNPTPSTTAPAGKADKNDPAALLQMQLLPVLLNRGFDVNKQNIDGKSSMSFALDALPRHLALPQLDSFIQNGGHIDAGDLTTGRTLLMAAVDACDIDLMRKLIGDYKADVNAVDAFGASALHRACAAGRRIGLIEQLLAFEQIRINQQDFEGQTPLHRAAARGRESVVKLLISKEMCDVNAADYDGNTPLHLAVNAGHFEIVDLLVSLNTNPRPISAGKTRGGAASGSTAPASGGGSGGAKKKDQSESNSNRLVVDAINGENHTSLELAVQQLNESNNYDDDDEEYDSSVFLMIVTKLLSAHATVHRVAEGTKLSLLQQAVLNRSPSLVDTFLSRGAEIHHRCALDKTALHYATENQDIEIVKLLLKANAVVDCQDSFRLLAPLHSACADLNVELVQLFINEPYNANVNITNNDFQTPLHIVCDCAAGAALTATKSNIIAHDGHHQREFLLQRATTIGNLLLERGALGGSLDRWKRTPLHYAAASNAVDLFRDLVVDVSHQVWMKDENDSTPLHIACTQKSIDIVEFICGLIETRHREGIAKTKTSKQVVLALEAAIAAGKEKIAAGSSRAVKTGADNVRPADPLVLMHQRKLNLELPEGAASVAATNMFEAENVSNELEGWRDGLKMKDSLGRTAMLLAAYAGSSEIGKLLNATQKVLAK